MAITLPKYLSPVTIDSTNNAMRITDSGGAHDVTLTAGDYYPEQSSSLLSHIQDRMNAAGTDAWEASLNQHKVEITCDAAWSIDWDYGSGACEALAAILGIASSSYATWDTGAADGVYLTADHQHQNGWYATQGVVSQPVDDHREASVKQERAASGRIYTVTEESYDVREIQHDYEPVYKLYPTSGYTNEDWTQSFWPTINAGQRLRYYPDATTDATYFDCVADLDTCRDAKPDRYDLGTNLYGFNVGLLGYV